MTKVVIANRWTGPNGQVYKGGDTAEVEPGTARDLLKRGKARAFVEEPAVHEPASVAEPSIGAVGPAQAADSLGSPSTAQEKPATTTTKPATRPRRGDKKEIPNDD